jgi:hypothetical protein
MSITPILTVSILKGLGRRRKGGRRFSARPGGYFRPAIDSQGGQISICEVTGLSMPECSCGRCVERLLEEFAPTAMIVRRVEALPEVMEESDTGELPQGAIPPGP